MEELTPIQKIDKVLIFFATHKMADLYMPYEVIITNCLNEDGRKFNNNELVMILNKLQKDGYILHDNGTHPYTQKETPLYFITFEGKIFYQQGGYGQQIIRQNDENVRVLNLEISHETLMRKLNALTFWIATGTVGLVLIEAIKLLNEHFHWWD